MKIWKVIVAAMVIMGTVVGVLGQLTVEAKFPR